MPDVVNSGYKLRISNLIQILNQKFDIHYLHISDKASRKFISSNKYYFLKARNKNIMTLIKSIIYRIPFTVCRFTPTYLNSLIEDIVKDNHIDVIYLNQSIYNLRKTSYRKIFIDQHDYISETFKTAFENERSLLKKIIFKREYFRFLSFEKKFYDTINDANLKVFCITEKHKIKTSNLAPNASLYVIPNAVSINKITKLPQKNLLFVGTSHYRNINALREFYEIIKLLDKSILSKISIQIVGAFNLKDLLFIDQKLYPISIHTFVNDVNVYYNNSICIAPYKMGGGSKLKVIESLANNIPVYGYEKTFVGIENVPAKFICKERKDFVKVINNYAKNKLNNVTKELNEIFNKYDWKYVSNDFAEAIDQ
jgi:hypothetical protein